MSYGRPLHLILCPYLDKKVSYGQPLHPILCPYLNKKVSYGQNSALFWPISWLHSMEYRQTSSLENANINQVKRDSFLIFLINVSSMIHRKKVPTGRQTTGRWWAKRNPCYVPRLRRSAEGTTGSSLPPFPGLVLPHTRNRGFAPACGLSAPFGAFPEHINQKACQITAPIQHPPCSILQIFEGKMPPDRLVFQSGGKMG